MLIYQSNDEEFIEIGGVKVPKELKLKNSAVTVNDNSVTYKICDEVHMNFNGDTFEVTVFLSNNSNQMVFFVRPDIKVMNETCLLGMIGILQTKQVPESMLQILHPCSKFIKKVGQEYIVIYDKVNLIEYIYFPYLNIQLMYRANGSGALIFDNMFQSFVALKDAEDMHAIFTFVQHRSYESIKKFFEYNCKIKLGEHELSVCTKSFKYSDQWFKVYVEFLNNYYVITMYEVSSKQEYKIILSYKDGGLFGLMGVLKDDKLDSRNLPIYQIPDSITETIFIEWIKLYESTHVA
jgi:hypothetical protein